MTTQGIAVREEGGLTQAGLDYTRDQLKLLEDFVKDVLRKDEDYGVIPGTNGKPTLLKPGAANVTAAFNCHAEPTIDSFVLTTTSSLNPDGFVSYEAHVDLVSNKSGLVMARGFGNCNSYETKYRYRWQGRGEDRVRVVNEDPLEQANTIKKMAIKRAEVDAAMRLPGVARFFTQDLEDMEAGSITPEKATPKDNRYACPDHPGKTWAKHTSKDGKTSWYSHKQGDGWCNMKDARLDAKDKQDWTEADHAAEAQDTPPEAQGASSEPMLIGQPTGVALPLHSTGELVNAGEVFEYAVKILGYANRQQVLAVPGVEAAMQAKKYHEVVGLLTAAKEQAKKG